MSKKRVLAGMRPTSRLHIGNYLGAAKGMVELQNDPNYETLYCVVDLHAMTTPYDKESLNGVTRQVVLDYLAVGLDPEKSAIFVQSDLADLHAQMMFYLSTAVTVARMQHLPTFKEKVKQYPENVTMALLNYPVLMAADILIYKAEKVPVGIDQEPHLEVAREIARKMNNEYRTDFPEPTRFKTKGEYVPSLTGEGKMSKSVAGSYIALTDGLETVKSRLAATPTDSGKGTKDVEVKVGGDEINQETHGNVTYRDKMTGEVSPGVKTLLTLVELFQGEKKRKEYENMYQESGIKYQELKNDLAEAIYEELKPIQDRREGLEKDSEYIDRVLKQGAEKAREVATNTVKEVKNKMGLLSINNT